MPAADPAGQYIPAGQAAFGKFTGHIHPLAHIAHVPEMFSYPGRHEHIEPILYSPSGHTHVLLTCICVAPHLQAFMSLPPDEQAQLDMLLEPALDPDKAGHEIGNVANNGQYVFSGHVMQVPSLKYEPRLHAVHVALSLTIPKRMSGCPKYVRG
jgi:hypothetical protein